MSKQPCVIGLTGGIASGKSTVCELLGLYGARVVNADKLGHQCYKPGSACLRQVLAAFGDHLLLEDGTLNRTALGQIVFGDKEQLQRLNEIVWPHIGKLLQDDIDAHKSNNDSVLVVEAAVMMEAQWTDGYDEIWVTYVSPETARARLVIRNNISASDADSRIASQLSNEQRLLKADVKICNDGSSAELTAQVEAAWSALQSRRCETTGNTAKEQSTCSRL